MEVTNDSNENNKKQLEMDNNSVIEYVYIQDTYLPPVFKNYQEEIENFEVFDDDVWLCSYPKTGTTWTQEIVWLLCNNLDYELAKQDQEERFPFFEIEVIAPEFTKQFQPVECFSNSINYVRNMKRPRLIKTHLPFNLLPKDIQTGRKKPKIIYVYRNSKDTCVSYYNHSCISENFKGTAETFADLFLEGKVLYGLYWNHVLSYWTKKEETNNIHYVKYEDLKNDLKNEIEKLCKFLKVKRPNFVQMEILLDYLSFEKMKNNPAVNKSQMIETISNFYQNFHTRSFMNKGEVGTYKSVLSNETLQKIDMKTEEYFKGTEILINQKKY